MFVRALLRRKKPSPRSSGRGLFSLNVVLVVVVNLGGRLFVEVARGANRLLAGECARKPGGFVPGQMVGGVHVFSVRRVLLASEDLRLLLRSEEHTSELQSPTN